MDRGGQDRGGQGVQAKAGMGSSMYVGRRNWEVNLFGVEIQGEVKI